MKKLLIAAFAVLTLVGCSGTDGVDGKDGENLTVVIDVVQPLAEPSEYFDLQTGVMAINAEIDAVGAGTVTLKYSVLDNGGDNNFVFSEYVNGTLVDYAYPDEVSNSKSTRVDFINEFYIAPNLGDADVTYKFEVLYDRYDSEDNYIRDIFVTGTITQKPYKTGLTEEEIVELIEVTIEESVGEIEIVVEAPECVVCEEDNETVEPTA